MSYSTWVVLCPICGRLVIDHPLGKTSHFRKHVRQGEMTEKRIEYDGKDTIQWTTTGEPKYQAQRLLYCTGDGKA